MAIETGEGTFGFTFVKGGAAAVEVRRRDESEQVDNLGAFRGLAFALGFQLVFVLMVVGGWEVWRMIR